MGVPRVKRETENGVEVAVLVSPGYGAGWSSWCHEAEETEILLFHKDLVELVLKGESGSVQEAWLLAEEMTEAYIGGAESLMVVWVPEGSRFIIHEYDGSENLVLEKDFDWSVA